MQIKRDEKILEREYPFEIHRYVEHRRNNNLNSFHWHNYFEITYVEKGRANYYVNGREYRVEAGDIILFNHIEAHCWEVLDQEVCLLVMMFGSELIAERTSIFDYDYLLPFLERGSNFQNKMAKAEPHTDEIRDILMEIYQEYQSGEIGCQLMVKADILRILTILVRHFQRQEGARELLSLKKDTMKRLEQVFIYIKNHYCEKISLEEVSTIACMSPTYFSAYFKKVTDIRFQDYLVQIRIQKARALLTHTDKGIIEIANDCGFPNMSNFYRMYKRLKGKSPGEERK